MGTLVTQDAYGHLRDTGNNQYPITAAASGTAAGTVVPVAAGAGTGSSVTVPAGNSCNDLRGIFNIVGAGTPAAGNVATINFAQPYAAVPVVLVELTNASGATVSASASAVTVNGFSVNAASAISAATGNTCSYFVVAQ